MAIKTDSTVDDPEMLGDGTQYIPEYRPPDYEVIGADGGLFTGGLGQPTGNLADVLRTDIEYAPGYYPGQGVYVNESDADRLGLGGNIFLSNPNWTGFLNPISTQPTGPAAPAQTPQQIADAAQQATGWKRAERADESTLYGQIYNQRLDILNEQRAKNNQLPIGTLDTDILRGLADDAMRGVEREIAGQEVDIQRAIRAQAVAAKNAQTGIPLILPIPGLDPTTAAILTAAGIIFSGGKIARLNPQNPAGSVAGAVAGAGQTAVNAGNVITGNTSIDEIWNPGSTGAPSGATGGGTGAGSTAGAGQQTTGSGVPGVIGGIFGGGTSSGGGDTSSQQGGTTGTVGVTPGALGGNTSSQPAQVSIRQEATAEQPVLQRTSSVPTQAIGTEQITPATPALGGRQIRQEATAEQNIVSQTPAIDLAPEVQTPVVYRSPIATATTTTVRQTPATDLEPDVKPPVITPNPSVTPTTTTTTPTGTAATPIVINAPTVGYTLPSAGTPVQRNLYTEAGTTLASLASPMRQFQIGVDAQGQPIYGTVPSGEGGQPLNLSQAISQGYGGLSQGMTQQDITNLLNSIRAQTGYQVQPGQEGGYQGALTQAASEQTAASNRALRAGNIADVESLAARAQALRQQANPQLFGDTGTLGQYATAAQNQVARDIAALRSAEQGNLTPEEVRNAQQAAREAYAARGQVMSQGAAAQEVLNRQAAVQQRQQLARQNLAQSMGQLGQGVAYQTANIFDPMAAVLGGQYGMQSQNVGLNQALYNQAMGLTSGAGGYGFAQQMINPFSGYAQDVYGTNVNAANAAQIAAANRQAALEAAKMGQTGTYAQALGGLISSGGLNQIQSGVTSGIQGLLSLLGGQWPTGSSSMITPTVARPGT